jgi:peptidoglycan/xylan/chitin deacetylase (PgdA/CDA1 family)
VTGLARRTARTVTSGPLGATAIAAVDRVLPRRRGDLAVLTYHRVDEPAARPDLLPGLLSASPSAFAEQMALVARDYEPVALADVLDALDRPTVLPKRAVLVTFDDGYRDFAGHAWPVLRESSVPVTLFVATRGSDEPDRGFWWDRLWAALAATERDVLDTPVGAVQLTSDADRVAAIARIRTWLKELEHDAAMGQVETLIGELGGPVGEPVRTFLGWDELRTLARDGVTLAPHTHEHPLLDRVPLERAVAEIERSRDALTRETGAIAPIPPALAYPSGAHAGDAVEAARRAGMRLAFTTDRGGNDLRRADPLRLRRINVGRRAAAALVHAQLVWATSVDPRRAPGR